MSNLATAGHLRHATSQLPVASYCDPAVYAAEQRLLFAQAPGYVGHELMVPNPGDYHALEWRDNAQALIRNAQSIELVSNICRHRQAIMLKGRGNVPNVVCPIHRWTYDLKGELLGAPHFDERPCLNLGRTPLQNWKGLLFDGKRDVRGDLAALGVQDFDFSNHILDRVEIHECNYNWKTFIEVYLEDYHVVPFHPGLGNFVTCDDLTWEFAPWASLQTVGITNLARSGSRTYERWHKAVRDYYRGESPRHGAVWLTYYPEPHARVVSACAGDQHRDTARPRPQHQRRGVLLPRRHRAVRARVRRSRAGRLHGNGDRGRRDRRADGCRSQGPVQAGPQRRRPLPVADGRRHAALP